MDPFACCKSNKQQAVMLWMMTANMKFHFFVACPRNNDHVTVGSSKDLG